MARVTPSGVSVILVSSRYYFVHSSPFPSSLAPATNSAFTYHQILTCLATQKFLQRILYTTMKGPSPQVGFEDKKDKKDQIRECYGKESCDFGAKRRFSDDIMPHILNLYGSCATAHDFDIYAPDASFEDPLMCAHGVKQIKSAFYSISKVFSESRIVEYSVEENVMAPGKHEILIDNKQHYKMLGKNIDMISFIKLYVEDGKVVRHEDWWDKKPISNRETSTFPVVGRLKEMMRRGSMFATHALMGFGKDPTA